MSSPLLRAWWARAVLLALVVVVGQVRRRFFRAGGVTQSRTEVVASYIVGARRASDVRKALQRARSRLDDELTTDA